MKKRAQHPTPSKIIITMAAITVHSVQLCFFYYNNGKQIKNKKQSQSEQTGRSQARCKQSNLGERQRHKPETRIVVVTINMVAMKQKAYYRQVL